MIKVLRAENINSFLEKISKRDSEVNETIENTVKEIINAVKSQKDKALNFYTQKFDNIPAVYEVSKAEIENAYKTCDKAFISSLKKAYDNIYDFHLRQKRQGFTVKEKDGIVLGYRIKPIEKVGLYVPGGTAAYPSSVLMNAIPAKIAGVKEIVMITPPSKGGKANPDILAAAFMCGVNRVFIAGGAQGIAALAFGTETMLKVDKIVGPGNIYVATAKKLLFGVVDIDMIAGPSEILIIADEKANPAFIAADMLSQAEHDSLSSSILITTSEEIAEKVKCEIDLQTKNLERKDIIEKSISNFGAIIICESILEAVKLSNIIAPEHLEIMTQNPFELLEQIENAGSVFLGDYSPEPLGDYYSGTNHVLPTNGTSRFFSSLGVDSFLKKSAFTYYSEKALKDCCQDILNLANKEGLSAHANSIKIRL